MPDTGLPATRPKHARTTSISTNTTSHQRKSSLKTRHEQTKQDNKKQSLLSSFRLKINTFLNPSGPLLPHAKQSQAFGGMKKPSLVRSLLQSRLFLLVTLIYTLFSLCLSFQHIWHYLTTQTPTYDWIPQRTYDKDSTFSLLNQMTHGLKMHKLFSKSNYNQAKHIQPFWQKASTPIDKDKVTLMTLMTPDTWKDMKQLTTVWKGPISCVLHVNDETELSWIARDYQTLSNTQMDVHVTVVPGSQSNVLLSRNAERNLARLLARTDTVLDLPMDVFPATDLEKTLEEDAIQQLIRAGDLIAVPTFSLRSSTIGSKEEVVQGLQEGTVVLDDTHWNDLQKWIHADTMYTMDNYEFQYEPVVIGSKSVQPWCSERFLDNRAACIFTSYLQGNHIWVLPHDFMIRSTLQEKHVSDLDNVIENRLYAKFYWEQCVYQARQLDALGLWMSPKSTHIRHQCSRVIQNWGKGLIGKT